MWLDWRGKMVEKKDRGVFDKFALLDGRGS